MKKAENEVQSTEKIFASKSNLLQQVKRDLSRWKAAALNEDLRKEKEYLSQLRAHFKKGEKEYLSLQKKLKNLMSFD